MTRIVGPQHYCASLSIRCLSRGAGDDILLSATLFGYEMSRSSSPMQLCLVASAQHAPWSVRSSHFVSSQ